MLNPRKSIWVSLLGLWVGCAPAAGGTGPTQHFSTFQPLSRAPDGVAPTQQAMTGTPQVSADPGGVAFLAEPLSQTRIAGVINRYFDGWVAEDSHAVMSQCDSEATLRMQPREWRLEQALHRRFREQDFTALTGLPFFHIEPDIVPAAGYPEFERSRIVHGDVVVTVVLDPAVAKDFPFGTRVRFLLRRRANKLVIMSIIEDSP